MQREITWQIALLSLGQTVLFVSAAGAAILAGAPWAAIAGLLFLGAAGIWVTISGSATGRCAAAGWAASLLVGGVACWKSKDFGGLKIDYIAAAALVTVAILTASQRIEPAAPRQPWRLLTIAWGFVAAGAWLASAYLRNQFYGFHFAILVILGLLVAGRVLLRMPGAAIQVINTLILLLIAVPLYDGVTRPRYRLQEEFDAGKRYYSFDAARKDPAAFAWWWATFHKQAMSLHEAIGAKETDKRLRYKFRPNSEAKFFDSAIKINSLGFRGPEIDADKGNKYRIIALGESTTFGYTLTADARPWPVLLEESFARRLLLDRPVQVINAGIYGFNIQENAHRLETRLLALKPDMIISYHGYNFFPSLNAAIPLVRRQPPPPFAERPLKLLADLEYRLQMARYMQKTVRLPALPAQPSTEPMQSAYAREYEKLIRITQENGIRLVLANFSMAVNAQSKQEVVEFYRGGFPEVHEVIAANVIHTGIVAELGRRHPEVILVNTHPGLDGEHEKYIDLVHFTQEGRNQLAETFYAAIKDAVAKETVSK